MSISETSQHTKEYQAVRWLNRRAYIRYSCAPATPGKVFSEQSADTTSQQTTQFIRAWILDLSKSGAGILLDRPLSTGCEVTIHITSPSAEHKLEISAQVVHATMKSSGDWFLGISFVRFLDDDELDAILYS